MAGKATSMFKLLRTYPALQGSGEKVSFPVWALRRQYTPGPDDSASSGAGPGEGVADQKSKEPKKSRTGGDMTDDGQVYTPTLEKTRSTLDLFGTKTKETHDRQAAEKEQA